MIPLVPVVSATLSAVSNGISAACASIQLATRFSLGVSWLKVASIRLSISGLVVITASLLTGCQWPEFCYLVNNA